MIRSLLETEIRQLQKQQEWLERSYLECLHIGIKPSYTYEEFGKFETLCSRFGRGIDFLVRKLYRTLDIFEFEEPGSLIDTVNRAAKRGLVDDIETLRLMKDIRNTLVHEYVEEALQELFEEVLTHTPHLLTLMRRALQYSRDTLAL